MLGPAMARRTAPVALDLDLEQQPGFFGQLLIKVRPACMLLMDLHAAGQSAPCLHGGGCSEKAQGESTS